MLPLHHVQQFRDAAGGIAFPAGGQGLGKLLRAAVPGGVGGGDAIADLIRRQGLVPIVHPLVPHEDQIGQHRVRRFQEAAVEFLAGALCQRVTPQVEDNELVQRDCVRMVEDILKVFIIQGLGDAKGLQVDADCLPLRLLQFREAGGDWGCFFRRQVLRRRSGRRSPLPAAGGKQEAQRQRQSGDARDVRLHITCSGPRQWPWRRFCPRP